MVTRLSDGLTPGDGSDPRTFPSIWNVTAGTIESQGSAITAAESDIDTLQSDVTAAESDIDDLEAKNIPSFGTAVPSDLQVLAFGTAASEFAPVTLDLDYLSDVSIGTAVSDGQVLAYSTAVSGWVNEDSAGGGGKVLQVVSTNTSTTTTTTSTSYVDFSGLSASITPSSPDNKILILVTFETSNNTSTSNFAQLYRDATTIGFERIIGCTTAGFRFTGAMQTFDSPSSTSSVTYSVDVKVASGTGFFLSGTITLMEIAG